MSAASATTTPVKIVVMYGIRLTGWSLAAHCGSRPSRAIAKKIRGWPYWNTSSTAVIETAAPSATIQPTVSNPARCSAWASGSATASSVYGTIPVSDEADDDVDDRADRQPAEDANRKVALRIAGLFGRGRDRVEANIGEEHDRRALMDAGEAVGANGV